MNDGQHLTRGGDGSHWATCHEAHYDCRLLWQERRVATLRAGYASLEELRAEDERQFVALLEQSEARIAELEAGIRNAIETIDNESYGNGTPWANVLWHELNALLANHKEK